MNSGPGYQRDPLHKVALEIANGRWRAVRDGKTLAESVNALRINEGGYPAAIYFPPDDVRFDLMQASDKHTYCPFKGDASYLSVDGVVVAWRYETPYDEVADIAGHVAFYTDQAEVSRLDD